MIVAIDTSSFIAFLNGDKGKDVNMVDAVLEQKRGVFPSLVVSEILSDYSLSNDMINHLVQIPRLEVDSGFWIRSGKLRAILLSKKRKARMADCLIAQNCIDHQVPLITRDSDFRHFTKYGGLSLV